jgi:hypothetical protein
MNRNYQTPSVTEMEIITEGSVMIAASFDSVNNTENLTWGEYEEL